MIVGFSSVAMPISKLPKPICKPAAVEYSTLILFQSMVIRFDRQAIFIHPWVM